MVSGTAQREGLGGGGALAPPPPPFYSKKKNIISMQVKKERNEKIIIILNGQLLKAFHLNAFPEAGDKLFFIEFHIGKSSNECIW